jgi:hypothetical protein
MRCRCHYGELSKSTIFSTLESRPNWDYPPPHLQASVSPPAFFEGRIDSLAGEGVGGPSSYEGTDNCGTQGTVYMYRYFVGKTQLPT